ncbi:MAG: DMT family transporter [Acidithiobacillus sp.]|uniref:DMT family transporter n=1 Tax=Acidithiobacillus sp. TaxID=1872118 RepID=UPI0025BAFA24|nr:DMT family transporter [Acidithiobacillus sp.]
MSVASFRESPRHLAIGALVLGAALWGGFWWPLRFFSGQGLAGPWLIAGIYLLLALPALTVVRWQRLHWRRDGKVLLALALLGGWTNVAFMLALFDGSVVRVLLLFYLSPVWSLLLAWLVLKESLGWRGVLAGALAIAGSILVIGHGQVGSWSAFDLDDLLAVSAGLAFAASNVLLRGNQSVPDRERAVAIWWGCASLGLMVALFSPWPRPHAELFWLLPAFSWFWVGGATAATLYGVARLPVGLSAVIMPVEILFGAASAWLLAGEAVTWSEFTGGLAILAAAGLQMRRPTLPGPVPTDSLGEEPRS